jgi:formylglycine-generating enzyme required for sulfatase activity
MAPEQALGEGDVDARADLWALGLLLYQGISGSLPTRADNLGQVIKAILVTPIPPLVELVPDVPKDVAALVAGLLAKARDERPGLDEVRSVLARHQAPALGALSGSTDGGAASLAVRSRPSHSSSPLSRSPRLPRARRLAPAIALGAAALAGALWFALPAARERLGAVPRLASSAPSSLGVSAAPAPAASAVAHVTACPDDMVRIESWWGPLEPYCMDKTEVTADAYMACVRAGKCQPALTKEVSSHRPQYERRAAKCNYGAPGRENHPINCLLWPMQMIYCQSVGKRLPTVEEWRWAAQTGTKGYLYPWGNELPRADQACWRGTETCAVGARPAGATPTGLQDLAGNVWEATSTPGWEPGRHMGCGGGFYEEKDTDLLALRCGDGWDDEAFHDGGFRCVL